MARPPETGGAKTKTYCVAAGFIICDFNGKRKEGGPVQGEGDSIELTAKQAKYYQKLNAITMYLEDDDDDKDAPATEEKSTGSKVDGGGESNVGDTVGKASAQKAEVSKPTL